MSLLTAALCSPRPHPRLVQVFGVTVYKFFDRYSRLRSVHQNMKAAGCLSSFPIEFPSKSWLQNHAADENAQQQRGQQLLTYYASLFTNAQVSPFVITTAPSASSARARAPAPTVCCFCPRR